MDLMCHEVLVRPSPTSLKHFALAAWINTRKYWDPDLAVHMCNVSVDINNIILRCAVNSKYGGFMYTYNNVRQIVEWERNRYKQLVSQSSTWWSRRDLPRNMVTVRLQDEIVMDKYPYKKVCRRLFTD